MRILGLIVVVIAGLCGCAERDLATDEAHWDYGAHGPDTWGDLSPAYILARIGGSQSPVDIDPARVITADLPPLEIDSHPTSMHIVNNGHTVQVICPGAATLRFGDAAYELEQLHFHAPSEHTVDGSPFAIEIHLVFSDGAGHLAVLGVLYEEGEETNEGIVSLVGRRIGEIQVPNPGDEWSSGRDHLDVAALLPDALDFYTYDGSLTTPPATEGVRWFVLREPVLISRTQVEIFQSLYFGIARPVQPLNARFILTGR